ncbi:DEAD/DEAH box helicase [Desulfonatronum thiodismutans]|uniref:DEAD/DEAH box helicase n=1 Tax=Desulfonatronum thiodismutans TaxID=159290 RepID=UPI00190F472E|nr:DEAD/DEAH box helicase [Desulfonatronum thiodismutans]
MQKLDWKDARGRTLAGMVGKEWREKMARLKLLSVKQGRLQLKMELRLEPLRVLDMEGRYSEVLRAVERVVRTPSYTVYDMDVSREWIGLRNALFVRDEKEVLKLIGAAQDPWSLAQSNRIDDLVGMCLVPLNMEWLERLPDVIKFQAVGTYLSNGQAFLIDTRDVWELARRWFPAMAGKHAGPRHVLAAQYLARGETDQARELLRDDQSAAGLALFGWLLFLLGEYDEAGKVFDDALVAVKKGTRKRNVRIPGMPGVFQNLALLRRGRPEDLRLVRHQASLIEKETHKDVYRFVFFLLAKFASVLLGEQKPEQFKQSLFSSSPAGTHTLLFGCLAQLWTGEKPKPAVLGQLAELGVHAEHVGYRWYAEETRRILEATKSGKLLSVFPGSEGVVSWKTLTFLFKPKEEWELALEALKNLGSASTSGGGARGAVVGEQRLTWRLYQAGKQFGLEPREQKLKANGTWTAGRPVALKKLRHSPESYSYLTEHDRRLCLAISEDTYSTYYGYYNKTEYSLVGDQALLAAVGHPLIFLEDDPERPVEMVQAEPSLQVLDEQDGLRVRVEPPLPENGTVAIHREGRHRLRVVRFDGQHAKIATILGEKGVKAPAAAKEQVLESIAEVAPLLTVHSTISGLGQAESVPADSRPVLRLRPVGDGLLIDLFFRPVPDGPLLVRPGEGGKTLFTEVEGRQVCATRDDKTEREAVQALLEHCPPLGLDTDANWSWRLEDPESALETLLSLQEMGDAVVLEWPEGKQVRIAAESGLNRFKIGLSRKQDWFAMNGGLDLDDGTVMEMSRLLSLLENSPGRFVRLEEGDFLCLTRDLRKRLDALRAYGDGGKVHPLAAPVLDEVLDGMRVTSPKAWKDLLRRVREAAELRPEVPSTLRAELREYQVEGFQWLVRLAHWGAGACLADDMGLGKTVQALALILTRAKQGPTLVLAPTSVCINWMEEVARFAPSLRPVRFGPGERERMVEQAGPFDLIVCSYGLLQTESELLAKIRWTTLVADEAQAIKNVVAKRSRAAMTLPADFKVITTGTPIENNLGELWNLFNFINPGLLGSLERFNRNFAVPIEQNRDAEAKRRLKSLIRPFILRRLKSEVLAELPSRTEVVLSVELSPEEAAVYDALRRRALEKMAEPDDDQPGQQRIKILAEIMRLRRACCHPELVMPGAGPKSGPGSAKLQAFGEILEDLLENKHQALVFSQFVDHLHLVRDYLDQRKVRYQYLDGSTPIKKRQQAVTAFQAGEGDLFLISLKAGGFGLNLTAADYVIHLDPWWNPAVEDQASDRAHRIGQQRPVTIYRLVTKGTIEEKILDLHRHKRDLATSLLEGTDSGIKLSVEEMLDLIRGAE